MDPVTCFECSKIIPSSKRLFGASCPGTCAAFAVCETCVGSVPTGSRRLDEGLSALENEVGIDIYAAEAAPTEEGFYDDATYQARRIAYSILNADGAAEKHLPKCFTKLPQPTVKNRATKQKKQRQVAA